MSRFDDAIARIDAIHAGDPEQVDDGGRRVARELIYARRMSAALARLEPAPSEALRLAVRAQHLARWALPRSAYPAGRSGYRRWRSEQARQHAARAAELLREVGYDAETIARVRKMITKAGLADDPDVQALEDAACLVFLEHTLDEFSRGHSDDEVVAILRKTWDKMSERGRGIALTLELPVRSRDLVSRAFAAPRPLR
jgi:hypothetical protein